MTRIIKKLTALLTVILILTGFLIINAGAADVRERIASFTEHNSDVLCIAHRGDWHSYPENSAEAIRAASEYGIVSVDVKITADGKAVLMADETLDRMCVMPDGTAANGNVSSYALDDIQNMLLRISNGVDRKSATDFHPASLKEAAEAAGSDAALMINLKCADFKTVYNEVKALGITDNVIFRFSDKNKRILETIDDTEGINVCGNYQGNIIFLATKVIKDSLSHRINTIELGSANGHGVLYDSFLMRRFDTNGKAMVSMVNGRCGKRTDNEKGWDDLITRGYSVIETDYPKELSEYIDRIEAEKLDLERHLTLNEETDLSLYTTDTESAFVSAVKNAKSALNKASSLSQLEDARFNLLSAADKLTVGAKKAVTLSFKPTPGRIIAVVLCGAAVLTSQILLYKRREKKN